MSSRNKQASLVSYFTRTTSYCKKIPSNANKNDLQSRLKELFENWEKFKDIQDEIEGICNNEQELNIQFSLRSQAEEYYYFSFTELQNKLDMFPLNQVPTNAAANVNYDIRMPRVNIPTFNSEYEHWPAFSDHFIKLVHENNSLSKVQKLHYLKSNVSGEAANLIREFSITELNYDEAWKTLLNRYNNKRFIIDSKLDAFLDYPPLLFESGIEIKNLLDMATRTVTILKTIGVEIGDCLLVHLLVRKLDKETRKQWELTLTRQQMPTFADLVAFMDNRWQSLERVPDDPIPVVKSSNSNKQSKSKSNSYSEKHHSFIANVNSNTHLCIICKKDHKLFMCSQFKSMTHEKKIELIKSHKLCFNCLRSGHMIQNCTVNVNCRHCNKRHHTSIHINATQQPENATIATATIATAPVSNITATANTTPVLNTVAANSSPQFAQANLSTSNNIVSNCASSNSDIRNTQILLATALVIIKSPSGEEITARALLDSGSQVSFVTEQLSQRLGLKKHATKFSITGIGHTDAGIVTSCVNFTLISCINSSFSINVSAFTMKDITGFQPHTSFTSSTSWKYIKNIALADPYFNVSGKIDILLGADVFTDLLLDGRIHEKNLPSAMNTQLGWVISGKLTVSENQSTLNRHHISTNHASLKPLDTLDHTLRKFWELEELVDIRQPTAEDTACEKFYLENHSRDLNGRYIVSLPFKDNSQPLGNSRKAAIARLMQMENKFRRNPELAENYSKFMKEYFDLGHMELVSASDKPRLQSDCFYLPHHAVLKESSTSTKLRVVFDGSCKTSSGVSLNDNLSIGPSIQDSLVSILLRWRKHKIVLIADIEKMYRQIKVKPNDSNFQRIVWRFSPNDPISDYRLTTVTYGTAPAAFLAIRSLRQLAYDTKSNYPEASDVVLSDFYVDDMMTGTDNITDAISLQDSLNTLLKLGGFQLKKWCSNYTEALHDIPSENCQLQNPSLLIMENSIKALGIYWNPSTDNFEFKISQSPFPKSTKRNMLSDIAKLFDPLGWLSPVTILAKILLQRLWLLGVSWDEELPKDITDQWLEYRNQLCEIQNIKIHRWIGSTKNIKVELHGFSDASNAAYAAVVFSRTFLPDGTIQIQNLGAKTKVAPIKTVSLPRLELCGAVLLAKLMHSIQISLNHSNISLTAWSDSTITLAWIRGQPIRWKTFVANRITEILKYTNPDIWRHVTSTDNPADCASRGIFPRQLLEHSLWWSGPHWLSLASELHPKNQNFSTTEEIRTCNVVSSVATYYHEYLNLFSSIGKLLRVTALCKRFISNCRKPSQSRSFGSISVQDLEDVLLYYIKIIQNIDYKEEIANCNLGINLHSKSKIINLKPFMQQDVLRVGGRLSKSDLPFARKHPIILSKENPLTKLIIAQAHSLTLHGGTQLMMALIRRKYWIIGAKGLAKMFVRRCVTCFRYNSKAHHQIMGDLPVPRITASRPFLHSGMDFAGPITIKMYPGRCKKFSKGYICLFVCLSTKAIHIEFVSDLSTKAFIASYRRFVSRRGKCIHLYSDNGTNFVGASSELSHMFRNASKTTHPEIASLFQNDGTTFHFIPPASPHFGGLWEAGVKSIKYHLRRLIGNSILTFEEMTTILAQIEATLNSRPLCPLSNEPDDILALTPGHFLIGDAPISIPEPCILDTKIASLDRWKNIQKIHQSFWNIWSSEYLTRLQQRPKWLQQTNNINIGDLVLVREDNLPPSKWLLARVLDTHPGKDDKVRVVTLK